MAVGDPGLACPREHLGCFPVPSDFSADAFHNRSTHTISIHDHVTGARGRRCLSPLSTEAVDPAEKLYCAAQEFPSPIKTGMLDGMREKFSRGECGK
jgi:hypothetical protein